MKPVSENRISARTTRTCQLPEFIERSSGPVLGWEAAVNRDRGASRNAALPHHRAYGSVPRRFGGLSVHQLVHGRQTQAFEARVSEGAVQGVCEAQSPRTFWAEDDLAGRRPRHTEAPKLLISP